MNGICSNSSKSENRAPLKPVSNESDLQATQIQKIIRGFLARKSFLPSSLYSLYSRQCESFDTFTPRASEGKTVEYLPRDIEQIVIKETGIPQAKGRFAQNEAIRSVVRSLGLNKLIVPRSRLYKQYLIEERLRISTDPGYNATLYLSHPELFDELARQMTRLFQNAYIDYLVEKNKDDDHLVRIRYDNIPFLVKEEGKLSVDIGLIDLERSSVGTNLKSVSHRLYILSSLFPLHASLIEEEAERNGMKVGPEEKEKMQRAVFYAKCYLEKMAGEYSTRINPPSHYITYQDVSERRFGDALITYLHAKWVAFQHNLPLLYRAFPYSFELVLSDREIKYDAERQKGWNEAKYRKGFEIPSSSKSEQVPTLYSVRYFPECRWELANGKKHNGKPWVDHFAVDWKDRNFRKEIQSLVRPNKSLPSLSLPKDHICLALHYREGGGYDKDIHSLNLPLKFPPLNFYIEGILKMAQFFEGAPLYVYLFTDALNPGQCVEEIKRSLPADLDVCFDYRLEGNSHDQNVLEDFFAFFQFDALIHPQSNFSMIPALINDYAATYTVESALQTEEGAVVESTGFSIDEERSQECLKRVRGLT